MTDTWIFLSLSVLVGGIGGGTNLRYGAVNHTLTQRALAAKSLDEAQRMILQGFLKFIDMPLIVVMSGIAAGDWKNGIDCNLH